jgi:hypothetical protein
MAQLCTALAALMACMSHTAHQHWLPEDKKTNDGCTPSLVSPRKALLHALFAWWPPSESILYLRARAPPSPPLPCVYVSLFGPFTLNLPLYHYCPVVHATQPCS